MFLPYPDAIHGCMDPIACNYDPEANASAQNHNGAYGCDYSCLGCNDPAACNYNYNNVVGNNDGCLCLSNCNKTMFQITTLRHILKMNNLVLVIPLIQGEILSVIIIMFLLNY